MAHTNVALIGFMGAGKSTIGRGLAARIGKSFVETDALVEQRAGMTVADIFALRGEELFRDIEAQVVEHVAQLRDCVISCGGGVVLRHENVAALRSSSILVFLDVTPATVLQRLKPGSRPRPLLNTPDQESRVRELMEQRLPAYGAAADITVQTDGLTVEQVVRRIAKRLKQL